MALAVKEDTISLDQKKSGLRFRHASLYALSDSLT